jgi:hypothetical protein
VGKICKLRHEQHEVEPAQGGGWQCPLPAQWEEGWKGALLQTADCAPLPPPPNEMRSAPYVMSGLLVVSNSWSCSTTVQGKTHSRVGVLQQRECTSGAFGCNPEQHGTSGRPPAQGAQAGATAPKKV